MGEIVRLLSKREVIARVGVSYSTIWRWMRAGKFPRALAVGELTKWRSDEIDEWLGELPMREIKDAEKPVIKHEGWRAYENQKHAAKNRDIEWDFTFETWIKWWEQQLGPDWMKLRGRQSDQYVMARPGDVGPYSIENVKCIRAGENVSEAAPARCIGDRPMTGAERVRRYKARKKTEENL